VSEANAEEISRVSSREKGERAMKTIALIALLLAGLMTAAGCHWRTHRHFSHGYHHHDRD
jgi:hypothetical protein